MMTTCPKCGFEQPEDRFCANCGIQMASYKARKPSWAKRILESTTFYAILLVTVFGLASYFIYQHARKNADLNEANLAQNPAPLAAKRGPEQGTTTPAQTRAGGSTQGVPGFGPKEGVGTHQAMGLSGENPTAPHGGETNESGESQTTAPTPSAGLKGESTAKAKTRSEVEVHFLKIDQAYLDGFNSDADSRLQIGTASAGIIPNFKSKLDTGIRQNLVENLATETRSIAPNQQSIIFQGGREQKTSDSIGFFVEVYPTKQTDKGVEIKVNVRRVLPDASGGTPQHIVSANFDDTFVIPNGNAAFMGGLLPHDVSARVEMPEQFATIPVLRPLLDKGFQSNTSEFVILVAPSLTDTTSLQ